MEIRQIGAGLFHADGRTNEKKWSLDKYGETNCRFRNSVKAWQSMTITYPVSFFYL